MRLSSLMYAVLDGRTAPIVVDSRYTFTPWEVARGYVVFRKGFDLPIGATITLNLSSCGGIYDSINMNKGSIQLLGNLYLMKGATFIGDGFIFQNQNDARMRTIYFDDNLILNNNYLGISVRRFSIRSTNRGRFDFLNNAKMDVRNVSRQFTISNSRFFDHGSSLLTSLTTAIAGFIFESCALYLGIDSVTEYFPSSTALNGIGSITTNTLFKTKNISMNGTAEWSILSGSHLQVEQLSLFFGQTRFFVYDAEIDLASTTTSPVTIGVIGGNAEQGLFSVLRKCKLKSSTHNTINVLSGIKLEMQTGAKLYLDNTHLTIL